MSAATFARYIAHGRAAIATHPDIAGLDEDTAAVDTIASILHAVCDTFDANPGRRGRALLERAWECYTGDHEELEEGVWL